MPGGRCQPAHGWFVLVAGWPGSGKSTLAAALATELGLPLLAKDEIKKALMEGLGRPETVAASRRLGRAAVLAMLRTARTCPGAVLDSTWYDYALPLARTLPGRLGRRPAASRGPPRRPGPPSGPRCGPGSGTGPTCRCGPPGQARHRGEPGARTAFPRSATMTKGPPRPAVPAWAQRGPRRARDSRSGTGGCRDAGRGRRGRRQPAPAQVDDG